MSICWLSAPRTISITGVRTPRETQRAPSSANIASAIRTPSPCGSWGTVVKRTRGESPGWGIEVMALRSTPCTDSVYRCSSKIASSPLAHASPTSAVSGAITSVTKRARPALTASSASSRRSSSTRWSAISWRNGRSVPSGRFSVDSRPGPAVACLGQGLQLPERLLGDLAGTVALVHQALEQAKLVDLLRRVHALPVGIAGRLRKPVATLPDPERIFRQAGVPLDGGDRQSGSGRGGLKSSGCSSAHPAFCPRQTLDSSTKCSLRPPINRVPADRAGPPSVSAYFRQSSHVIQLHARDWTRSSPPC